MTDKKNGYTHFMTIPIIPIEKEEWILYSDEYPRGKVIKKIGDRL